MKVFAVFLALCIVFSGLIVFASDIAAYRGLLRRVKTLAEECAQAAALSIDEEKSLEQGRPVIDIKRAESTVEKLCEKVANTRCFGKNARVTADLTLESLGKVCAAVSVECGDVFSSSFIKKDCIQRSAVYEWK